MEKTDQDSVQTTDVVQDEVKTWVKPEIVSYSPVTAAEGISYRPSDGLSNLTP